MPRASVSTVPSDMSSMLPSPNVPSGNGVMFCQLPMPPGVVGGVNSSPVFVSPTPTVPVFALAVPTTPLVPFSVKVFVPVTVIVNPLLTLKLLLPALAKPVMPERLTLLPFKTYGASGVEVVTVIGPPAVPTTDVIESLMFVYSPPTTNTWPVCNTTEPKNSRPTLLFASGCQLPFA